MAQLPMGTLLILLQLTLPLPSHSLLLLQRLMKQGIPLAKQLRKVENKRRNPASKPLPDLSEETQLQSLIL